MNRDERSQQLLEQVSEKMGKPLMENSKKYAKEVMHLDQSASEGMWDGPLGDLSRALTKEGKSKEAEALGNAWDGDVKKLQKKIKELGLI